MIQGSNRSVFLCIHYTKLIASSLVPFMCITYYNYSAALFSPYDLTHVSCVLHTGFCPTQAVLSEEDMPVSPSLLRGSEVEPRNNRLSGLLCTQQGKMGSSFAVKIYISLFLGSWCSPFPTTHIAVWVFFFLWAAAAIPDTPHVLLPTKA